ncbi:hypothetical protein D3C78_1073760 [compost metagenome]
MLVARREGDLPGGRQPCRVIQIARQPFKHQRARHRAFHRAAHVFPRYRRTRVQNGGTRHARDDVDSLVKAHQHRMGLNNALQRDFVGGSDFVGQRRVRQLIQGFHHLHIALPRRGPVELRDRNVLLFQVIAEQGDTDVNDVQWLVK